MTIDHLAPRLARGRRYVARLGARAALVGLLLGHAAAALAQQPVAARAPLVVGSDYGGDVGARANKIAAMRKAGQHAEIRGRLCYSACTMYLSLPGTCVQPNTRFGFHGPSFYGLALAPEQFEFWSRIIAAHYPQPLQRWYLKTGRHSRALIKIRGSELIRLGIPACG
ncbi:hypothetical protein DL1_09165 [Thioclava dalianensis]|uniref:Uncharacterized protein n=1 Tax=Thioclava dalianensis TaxID=1185766 RepID=A0A074TAJ5_9RHOB|nr:hypothetical protein [Thioclava dalianensis]KEP68724.1 hypothetical protein DL1_09165 [Thioclava dalianensis]SFN59549.1 hypothetical protein SAMN05216224_107164 [Thioclava dalianensis]